MSKVTSAAIAVAAASLICAGAFAATPSTTSPDNLPETSQTTPAQETAERDFGRVSADGFKAMSDVRLARLAIFNADPASAKSDLADAVAALDRARSDDTIFMKAESELKTPAGLTQPHQAGETVGSTRIKWLPVDGAMTLGEDYVTTPAKTASVAKANEQIQKGDHAHALQTLRLAGIDVAFDMEVAPLNKTIAGVTQAQQLADAGHYYQANQALKSVQDGARFDVENLSAVPKTASNTTPSGKTVNTASAGK
jgi:hypothetical protein